MDIYGNKLVNTIETKPLCASSSKLAEILTMVTVFILEVKGQDHNRHRCQMWDVRGCYVLRCLVDVVFRSEKTVLLRKGPSVTYICPTLGESGRKTKTLVRNHEYFHPPKFHQAVLEKKFKKNSLTERQRVDDGQCMIAIGHWSLPASAPLPEIVYSSFVLWIYFPSKNI